MKKSTCDFRQHMTIVKYRGEYQAVYHLRCLTHDLNTSYLDPENRKTDKRKHKKENKA